MKGMSTEITNLNLLDTSDVITWRHNRKTSSKCLFWWFIACTLSNWALFSSMVIHFWYLRMHLQNRWLLRGLKFIMTSYQRIEMSKNSTFWLKPEFEKNRHLQFFLNFLKNFVLYCSNFFRFDFANWNMRWRHNSSKSTHIWVGVCVFPLPEVGHGRVIP